MSDLSLYADTAEPPGSHWSLPRSSRQKANKHSSQHVKLFLKGIAKVFMTCAKWSMDMRTKFQADSCSDVSVWVKVVDRLMAIPTNAEEFTAGVTANTIAPC